MIRRSTEASPGGVLSAYKDNASVIEGHTAGRFFANPDDGVYGAHTEPVHLLMKVETHNHPTAVSPVRGRVDGQRRRDPRRGRGRAAAASPRPGWWASRCRT